jgi:hypothetical protein
MIITAPPEKAVYSQIREVSMYHISSLVRNSVLAAAICFAAASAMAQTTGKLTDPQMVLMGWTPPDGINVPKWRC